MELSVSEVIDKYFPKSTPFNGQPREHQGEAIHKLYSSIVSGKRFVVIAAPTGAGKSAILYALTRAILDLDQDTNEFTGNGKATFTTSQKLLQDQYENDFKDMFVMKGRVNYPCKAPVNDSSSGCDNGVCLFKSNKPECIHSCPYKEAKNKAALANMMITNFAYFIGETNNVCFFGKRRVLIVDEAHNIENALMNYVECSISSWLLKFVDLEREIPMYDDFYRYKEFLDKLQEDAIESAKDLELKIELDPDSVLEKESKQLDKLKSLIRKIGFLKFHAGTCKWIVDGDKEKKKVAFKPINVSNFASGLIFGHADIIVLSSATISRSYVRDCLGVKDFEYIEVPSTFPVENRPIYAVSVGRMGYNYIEKTLPKIVRYIDDLLDEFKDQKGIIHATSYKIARYIEENSRHSHRLISHNSADRIERLTEHMQSKFPTVLLSPSMTEGVDLKGDLSKFQVIVKIPYASLADKQIKARMNEDSTWYANLAAVQMMQAYGRSIRSKDDVAVTFVLDSAFKYFVKSNDGLFCNWFKEAIL